MILFVPKLKKIFVRLLHRYWQRYGVHTPIEGSDGMLAWTDFHGFEVIWLNNALIMSHRQMVAFQLVFAAGDERCRRRWCDNLQKSAILRKLEIATTIAAQQSSLMSAERQRFGLSRMLDTM